MTPRLRLFILSFLSIYFEIAFIRWTAAHIPLVAYFVNFTLLTAFFGLSLGYILSERKPDLLRWMPAAIGVNVLLTWALRAFKPAGFIGESLYWIQPAPDSLGLKNLVLLLLFASIIIVFIPLGQAIGRLFGEMPKLTAYAINLTGALLGGLGFALNSFLSLPAGVWYCIGAVLMVSILPRPSRIAGVAVLAAACGVVFYLDAGRVVWSPYNRLEVLDFPTNTQPGYPQAYRLLVNRYLYQNVVDLETESARLDADPSLPAAILRDSKSIYRFPYRMAPAERVLIVGCGTGNDIAAALFSGKTVLDAVDIDGRIVDLGRRLHPNHPFDHPGVNVFIRDARSYFKTTQQTYDLIVFGFLDSQSLFSSMSSVRLDAYVYTEESLREAKKLLRPGGHLVIQYVSIRRWLTYRLYGTLESLFPGETYVFHYEEPGKPPDLGNLTLIGGKLADSAPPEGSGYVSVPMRKALVDPATDDWPFLYLQNRSIPREYLYFIATMLLAAILLTVLTIPRGGLGRGEWHFFFLGAGFMILETRSITQLALFVGSGWLTTLVTVSCILILLWAANAVMARRPEFLPARLFPIHLLGILMLWPAFAIARHFLGAGAGSLMIGLFYAVPFFTAGLIFSGSFARSTNPGRDLGLNTLGAFVGGFAEYLSMIIGFNNLLFLALAFYLAAWGFHRRRAVGRGDAA